MSASRRMQFGLPLLAKELLEQSARKRTYVLRTVYACLLFFVGLMMFYDVIYHRMQSPLSVLGQGRQVFEMLMGLQLAGIYLFMPTITCGVITAEKERKTLGLLLLTKLGPWTIVLEKFLGRCFTMLTFLMLCLPLLAFAYSLGGVSVQDLVAGAWMLFVTTLQVGAFAILCSCLFRTTAAAFIGTYVLGFLFYFGPVFLFELSDVFRFLFDAAATLTNLAFAPLVGEQMSVFRNSSYAPGLFIPPVMLFEEWNVSLPLAFIRSIPTLVSIAVFLSLARVFLVRRAFVPPRNPVLSVFRRLDGVFSRWNERWTRGIVLVKDATTLPEDEPIAWRETKKKSLGTARYLVRVFLVLEVPVLVACVMIMTIHADRSYYNRVPDEMSLMYFVMWLLAALMVVVKSTSLIAGERTHETLDVLLTTPLSTREIVGQKLRGMWRLVFVVAVPLVTIILFETWWRATVGLKPLDAFVQRQFWMNVLATAPLLAGAIGAWIVWRLTAGVPRPMRWAGLGVVFAVSILINACWLSTISHLGYSERNDQSPALYCISSLLAVAVYLPLMAWLSLYIGLRMKTQARALFGALAAVIGWCLGPVILLVPVFIAFFSGPLNPPLFLLLSGPATIVPFTEFTDLHELSSAPWLLVLLNFAFYGSMLLVIRNKCLSDASRFLGRAEPFQMPWP